MYDTPTIFTDSQSTILLSKNPIYHEKSKYIKVKYHFVKEKLSQGEVNLVKIHIDKNLTDMETKVLLARKFKMFVSFILTHVNFLL